jgi:hypothetical protein
VPLLDVLDPGPEDPELDAVLLLARDGAGVTADAAPLVDDEAEPSHVRVPPLVERDVAAYPSDDPPNAMTASS